MLETKDHINEAEFQLNNIDNYYTLPQDPTANNKFISQAIDYFKRGTLSAGRNVEALKMPDPKAACFYISRKFINQDIQVAPW